MDCQSPDQSSHFLLLNNPEICPTNKILLRYLGIKSQVPSNLLPKKVWLEVVSQGIMGSREGCRVKRRTTKGTWRRSQEAKRLRRTLLPTRSQQSM